MIHDQTKECWCVDNELISGRVIRGGGLHLHSVVAIPKLSQTKAAYIVHAVNAREQIVMPLSAKSEYGATEQVELDGHLGAHGGVDDCKLVSSEDLQGVVNKIKNRDETSIADGCETLKS